MATKSVSSEMSLFSAEMNAVFVYAMRIGGAVLTFLLQIFLARWMGQYEYGLFAFVWSCLIICGELLNFGFYNLIQRLLPQYRTTNDLPLIRGAIWGSARVIILSSSAVLIFIVGCLSFLLNQGLLSATYAYPLMIGATALPAFALSDYLSGIGRSYGWMIKAFTPTALIRPISIIAFTIGAAAYGLSKNAETAMLAASLSIWLTLFISIFLIGRDIPEEERTGQRQYQYKTWIVAAIPMMMVASFELLLFNIDVLMIGFFLTPDQTGSYFAATKIMALVAFVNFAVGSAFNAKYATHHASGNQKDLANTVTWSACLTFYPSLFMLLAIILLRDHLLGLFGASFIEASAIIFPISLGLICRALVGPGERILMMTNQQHICALIYLSTVIIDIILNLLLIPIYGIMGAAFATALSFIVMALLLHIAIRKKLNLASNPGSPALCYEKIKHMIQHR